MKRIHCFFSGKVQGVFFRDNTKMKAVSLGLVGFVRNLEDGRVEVVAEGEEEKLKELLEFCKKGEWGAEVTGIEINWEEVGEGEELEGFVVVY